jgi:cytoskeletal protein CcmA (bactofilin family)
MTPFGKTTPNSEPLPRPATAMSIIARESRVVGELRGSQGVRVEGGVSGIVAIEAPLEVAEKATVEAEVHASIVRVAGTVVGNITASKLVELLSGAVVKGDITTPALHVVEGAKLEGKVQMRTEPLAGKVTSGPQVEPREKK